MVVGTVQLQFLLRGVHTLKEKRQILRSFKDRLKHKFNVALAETDFQDLWQRAEVGIAAVGGDHAFVDSILTEVIAFARVFPHAELLAAPKETFTVEGGKFKIEV